MTISNPDSSSPFRFIVGAGGPPSSVREMLMVPLQRRDVDWLKSGLQMAAELELSTIPPYLCGLWSIQTQSGPVHDMIRGVALEEMGHMGLACNMLTTLGGTPRLAARDAVPKYPGHLPGGVRPELTVALAGLSKDVVLNTYMQIEYPEGGPIAFHLGATYPTIGAFYDGLLAAFRTVPASAITGQRQLTAAGPVGVFAVKTVADAERAIDKIKVQGEGTRQSPEAVGFGAELAHYYRFAEIYHGRTLVELPDHHYDYQGAPIPFPAVFPMAEVPPGGYPESRDFDQLYSKVLTLLEQAWQQGSQAVLQQAISAMFSLATPARALMQKPRPDGHGNFGPSFLLVPQAQEGHPPAPGGSTTPNPGGPMSKTTIRYADITAYLDAIMKVEHRPISGSPHKVWWRISYHAFTTGNVPGVTDDNGNPVPIMDSSHPLNSAFYVVLTNPNGFGDISPQMPEGGPFVTDAAYKTTLADGRSITGAEIIANMKSWLENGFPEN